MGIEIRTVADAEEFARWHAMAEIPFGSHGDDERRGLEERLMPFDRTIMVLDGDDIVGAASSYPFTITVPGGATRPAAGITAVGVLATHRRQGILREMMTRQLADVVARGEVFAVLNASEPAIYPRYGFGLAQWFHSLRVNPLRWGYRPEAAALASERRLRYVAPDAAAPVLGPIFDAYAAGRPGEVNRTSDWWQALVGPIATWKGGGPVYIVVCEPDSTAGRPGGPDEGGYVIFTLEAVGVEGRKRVGVRELVATGPSAEAALWRFAIEIDLVEVMEADAVPVDCPLRFWMADTRHCRVTQEHDYLFVRILDVVDALEARTYAVADDLVLDVVDPFRPSTSGRYRLEVDGAGHASCTRLDGRGEDRPIDLRLTIDHLGSAYLGGIRLDQLARAHLVEECTPGAATRAAAVFDTPTAPMCHTRF